jgi:hypothetical protein
MSFRNCLLVLSLLMAAELVSAQSKPKHGKKIVYEEVDFEDMMRRYFGKEKSDPLEGIYSVSCVITKRNKRFLSKRERIRIVGRKDNYARIALLKDWPGSKRDYIEVSLSYRDAKKYPIVGELNSLLEGQGFIYKHIEPDGMPVSFSMINESQEMLEAEYSDMQKRKTITYKLSYLKTYPKTSQLTVKN